MREKVILNILLLCMVVVGEVRLTNTVEYELTSRISHKKSKELEVKPLDI